MSPLSSPPSSASSCSFTPSQPSPPLLINTVDTESCIALHQSSESLALSEKREALETLFGNTPKRLDLSKYPELNLDPQVMKAVIYMEQWLPKEVPSLLNLIYSDLGWYEGTVNIHLVPHGYGIMRYKNGCLYDGDWYEGFWKCGKQEGKGTYRWESGTRYEGEWIEGKKQGEGTLIKSNGEQFSGKWNQDRPLYLIRL